MHLYSFFHTVFGFLFSKISNKNTGGPKIGLPVCLFHTVRVFDSEEYSTEFVHDPLMGQFVANSYKGRVGQLLPEFIGNIKYVMFFQAF